MWLRDPVRRHTMKGEQTEQPEDKQAHEPVRAPQICLPIRSFFSSSDRALAGSQVWRCSHDTYAKKQITATMRHTTKYNSACSIRPLRRPTT
jgi:hypothetical protein